MFNKVYAFSTLVILIFCSIHFSIAGEREFIEAARTGSFAKLMSELRLISELNGLDEIDINHTTSNGDTALILASSEGQEELVKKLLKLGAEVNIKNKSSGATALMKAAMGGYPAIVAYLVVFNADVKLTDHRNLTALAYACAFYKNLDVIKILLTEGSKTDETNETKKIILDLIKENKELEKLIQNNY